MQPIVRIVVVGALLAGGIGLSMMFREKGAERVSETPTPRELMLRAPEAAPQRVEGTVQRLGPDARSELPKVWIPEERIPGDWNSDDRTPEEGNSPIAPSGGVAPQPPTLPPRFEYALRSIDAALAAPDSSLPGRAVAPPVASGGHPMARIHKVADGDTLSNLAKRYLNDAGRYLEVYQLNRDLLTSPHELPIGARLRIPPQAQVSRIPPLGKLRPSLEPLAPRGQP